MIFDILLNAFMKSVCGLLTPLGLIRSNQSALTKLSLYKIMVFCSS